MKFIIDDSSDFNMKTGYLSDNMLVIHSVNDFPALIDRVNDRLWYKDGIAHRNKGPASIYISGFQEWYKNGKLHREDGPAKISRNGGEYYFLNSINFTKEQYWKKINDYNH